MIVPIPSHPSPIYFELLSIMCNSYTEIYKNIYFSIIINHLINKLILKFEIIFYKFILFLKITLIN